METEVFPNSTIKRGAEVPCLGMVANLVFNLRRHVQRFLAGDRLERVACDNPPSAPLRDGSLKSRRTIACGRVSARRIRAIPHDLGRVHFVDCAGA